MCIHDNTSSHVRAADSYTLLRISTKSNHGLVHAYDSEPESFVLLRRSAMHWRGVQRIQPDQCSRDGNARVKTELAVKHCTDLSELGGALY